MGFAACRASRCSGCLIAILSRRRPCTCLSWALAGGAALCGENKETKMRTPEWHKAIPDCAPSECFDSITFCEAMMYIRIELDLIEEGQEAAQAYTKRQVAQLRKCLKDNRASAQAAP